MSSFKYNFKDAEAAVKFSTQNQVYLSECEGRIRGVKAQIAAALEGTGDTELNRLEAAREDIISKMSADELAGYHAAIAATRLTDEQASEQRAIAVARMNENKDRASH